MGTPGHHDANPPIGNQEAQHKRGFLERYRIGSWIKTAYLPAGAGVSETLAVSTHNFFSASHLVPANPKLRVNNTSFQTSSSDSLLFHAFIFVLGTPSAIRQAHTESE